MADVLVNLQIKIVPLFVCVRKVAIHTPVKAKKKEESQSEDSDGTDDDEDAFTDEELSDIDLE